MTYPFEPLTRNVDDFTQEKHFSLLHLAEVKSTLPSLTPISVDISEFQNPLDDNYLQRAVIFRVGEGDYYKDHHFDANYAKAKFKYVTGKLDWFAIYHVGIKPGVRGAGNSLSQAEAIRNWVGEPLHSAGVFMEDCENWQGLQTGDLSTFFNNLMSNTAATLLIKDNRRLLGYANPSDWANLWPNRPAWLKRTIASWGANQPLGCFGWQYGGGMNNSTPSGLPNGIAPYGSGVDLNAFPGFTSHKNVALAFGIGETPTPTPAPPTPTKDWFDMATQADLKAVVDSALAANSHGPGYVRFINCGPKNNEAAIYKIVGNQLLHLDPVNWEWEGKPSYTLVDIRSIYWHFPIMPGTTDLRNSVVPPKSAEEA